MRVRFTTALGMPVIEEQGNETAAYVSGIFIHPDTAKIEGLFVKMPLFLQSEELFLSSADIMRWGTVIRIRSRDVLSPFEEMLRLQTLAQEGRPVLGQPVVTENGTRLGVCKDVQFDTTTLYMERIYPRRMLRWGLALPVSSIVKITPAAIVVRNAVMIPDAQTGPSVLETLDPLGSSGMTRKVQ